jgi:hypothetical protein
MRRLVAPAKRGSSSSWWAYFGSFGDDFFSEE